MTATILVVRHAIPHVAHLAQEAVPHHVQVNALQVVLGVVLLAVVAHVLGRVKVSAPQLVLVDVRADVVILVRRL